MRAGPKKRSRTIRRVAATLTASAALLCGVPSGMQGGDLSPVSAAHAQSRAQLDEAQGTLDFVSKQIVVLEERYLKPELTAVQFSLETRFNDARVAYELKQFDRASYLFLDVISRANTNFPGYRAGYYLLADSLIQQRNFIGARTYLRDLVKMGPGEYYQEALAKLLEIAYITDNYEGIGEIYSKLDANSGEAPALAYLRGKTLYEQGDFAGARTYFLKSANAEEFALKGRYFAAVTHVNEGNLDEALAGFDALTKKLPSDEGDVRVFFLAYLSMGRIAYEQERYQDALQLYSRIDRDDPNFIDAMYESAWTNIQLEKFEQAARVIDILIQAEPDPETYTRAMLLKADLSLRIEDYDEALLAYETVLERFDPVRQQLDAFAAEHEDLRGFFRGLVRDDLSLEVPEGLPTIRTDFKIHPPQKWLFENEQLTRTRQMVDDVGVTRVNLLSAFDDLAQIEARLDSGAAVKSFPKLAEGMALVTELESQLVGVQRLLVNRLALSISPALTGADQATWSQLRADLDLLEKRYQSIPQDAEALKAREERVSQDFQRLREQLNEAGYAIDQLRAELAAIDTYIQMQELPLSVEEREKVDELSEEIRETIKTLEQEQTRIRAEISRVRESAAGGDVVSIPEREVRTAYVVKLAEASDFLLQRKNLASADVSRIERLRAQVPPLHAKIQSYYGQMDSVVGNKSEEVRATIAALRVELKAQYDELDTVTTDSKGVAGDIALQTFNQKRTQFTGIILRADVGKIDVLFQSKEDSTNEINDLFQKRTNELRALQEAFEEVR